MKFQMTLMHKANVSCKKKTFDNIRKDRKVLSEFSLQKKSEKNKQAFPD